MSSRRHVLVAAAFLVGAAAPLLTLACSDRSAPSEPRQSASRSAARPPAEPAAEGSADRFGVEFINMGIAGALAGKLPSTDTVTSSVPAFEIKQKGGGIAGRFEITNSASAAIALDGVNAGTGHALLAWNYGKGRGAVVITSNSTNTLPALDVSSQSLGTSTIASALDVRANNTSATAPAVQLATSGPNTALLVNHKGASGDLAVFQTAGVDRARIDHNGQIRTNGGALLASNAANVFGAEIKANSTTATVPAARIETFGQSSVLLVNHAGSAGDLAVFQVAGVNQIRFDRTGRGLFNGGTISGGADVAEEFAVEGRRRDYAPGDVLVISDESDRRVEQSDEPYSTRVLGVYATKPGVLLTERTEAAALAAMVPVGVIGVIPTKVSAENGAIRRGDLLVTAATRGHAMRGTARDRMLGAVVGKALAEFAGPGTGVIPVLVNVR